MFTAQERNQIAVFTKREYARNALQYIHQFPSKNRYSITELGKTGGYIIDSTCMISGVTTIIRLGYLQALMGQLPGSVSNPWLSFPEYDFAELSKEMNGGQG